MSAQRRQVGKPGPRAAVDPLDRVGHVICLAFHGGRCLCAEREQHACDAARSAARHAIGVIDGLRGAGREVRV